MSDLGLTLAWLSVQVTLVAVPCVVLLALASRRDPAWGAWTAALGLGLVAALSLLALAGGVGRLCGMPPSRVGPHATLPPDHTAPAVVTGPRSERPRPGQVRPTNGRGWGLADLRRAWARFERGAAEPAARCRPLGAILAVVALGGMGVGLLRLIAGLWAVRTCRRRGKAVDDPGMTGLLDELWGAMGCRSPIGLLESAELASPATAGWRRPVVLLPEDWRSWEDSERRAVLAHELAHVVRGDYAAGLLARLAVALHSYHPLVHWIAGRLHLHQELAADALGARFGGGRESYLVALSRLALKQDGWSPSWPARAFLPRRGALIRRIEMLRDQIGSGTHDRPASRAWRLVAASTLLGATAGVAALRGPARGDEGKPAATSPEAKATPSPSAASPITSPYLGDGMTGLVSFRPAAALRRVDRGLIEPFASDIVGVALSQLSEGKQIDTSRPGFRKLGFADIEWVTCGFRIDGTRDNEGNKLHRIMSVGLTVRTASRFDWPAFLRQWRFDLTEVHEGERIYYRISGPWKQLLWGAPCMYSVDDRTVVFDQEGAIRTLLGPEPPPRPAFLRGADWERASLGLLAVAIDNHDDVFVKDYDQGRPDDAAVLSLFRGVNHWILKADDADSIALDATAFCRDGEASMAIASAVQSLWKMGRAAIEHAKPGAAGGGVRGRKLRMAQSLLAGHGIRISDRSVALNTRGSGSLTDLVRILVDDANERDTRDQAEGPSRSARR